MNKSTLVHYAHSRVGTRNHAEWHSLDEHLRSTAALSGQFASGWGAKDWAYLAGLWHDIGKYSDEFQSMIQLSDPDTHVEGRSHIDHSTAGAQHAVKMFPRKMIGKALAYIIAGHHCGLPDGESSGPCLEKRLSKNIPSYKACPEDVLNYRSELAFPFTLNRDHAPISISLFIRMLYSCLVDADFLDTEYFMNTGRSELRGSSNPVTSLEPRFFDVLARFRAQTPNSHVNSQREIVLARCVEASGQRVGLFSLTVPTGGGKTLSSMAFALRHACTHRLRRVIYVLPYTSIIEQNAEVFRQFLGNDAVLEHHSNFEPSEEDHWSRLAAENWDAPVIVTTNVQFFESLFANKSSRCRKLHNIAESVIILDEVQTLPSRYLLPCLEVLQELSRNYRTSVVLCSATQPAWNRRPDFPMGLEGIEEIIQSPQLLADALGRVQVRVFAPGPGSDIPVELNKHAQVLCIVNTRRDARELYGRIAHLVGSFHLSALMCPAHRSDVLTQVRDRLNEGAPCRVVSTQLIEAGVDIDFPVVYRALAGLDSIAQAAGRCNREGKLPFGRVYVFGAATSSPPGDLRQAAQAAETVIRKHSQNTLSLSAIEEFFKELYWTKGKRQLDAKEILDSLSEGLVNGSFPFQTVAERFQLIDDKRRPVIVPYNAKARQLINAIDHTEFPRAVSRKLQRFTVTIHTREWDRLYAMGCLELKSDLFPVLVDESLYDKQTGLRADDPLTRDPNELVL